MYEKKVLVYVQKMTACPGGGDKGMRLCQALEDMEAGSWT